MAALEMESWGAQGGASTGMPSAQGGGIALCVPSVAVIPSSRVSLAFLF